MNAITENQRGLRVFCNFLPKETLFGFKTLNCTIKCDDEMFRPLYGLELGFIFFTIQITYVDWKV
tara:strand:+ start:96 stop:290 length:195 start_codon:yes stop_codon:yes gene_type:complete